MKHTLNQDQILDIIPHRYENIIIDEVSTYTDDGTPVADLSVCIKAGDELNRDLFTKQWTADTRVILPSFYMEILALGAIARLGSKPGFTYVFSGISDFEWKSVHPLGETVHGKVVQTGVKGPFVISDGFINNASGTAIVKGSLMAASVPDEALTSPETESDYTHPSPDLDFTPTRSDGYKDSSMYFCDRLTKVDLDNGSVQGLYTYPTTHPCVKGHFPGAPVMMGVMQLACIEDTCEALHQYLKSQGEETFTSVTGDLTILNQNGDTIAVMKKFKVSYHQEDNVIPQCNLEAVKKISFKGMATPNDTLLLDFKNIQLHA